jgi:YcxB-like protein
VILPVEISYAMTDADLYQMVMHSKSRLLGWSGKTMVKVFMGVIALAFAMMAFGLPIVVGMADDDPGKMPFQFGLVGAGAILVLLYPRYARWYTRRASMAYQNLPLPMRLVIDDAGIQAHLDGQSGSTAWKLIERSVETDTHVFLYLNRLRAYIIPKAALKSDADHKRLRELMAAHVVPLA